MLTWICTNRTLIHVLIAGSAHKASRAGADGAAIEGVGVTHCPFVAGVAHTCIVQVAQQTRLSNWTGAEEGRDTVEARGAIEANGDRAVVNVLAAVVADPAVHTDAGVTPDGVEASAAIVTRIGLHETLIDVLSTVLSCPFRRALAIVRIHSINAYSSIHALVTRTVVHVILTVVSLKPW